MEFNSTHTTNPNLLQT
jgi:hypothetical protein